MGPDHSQLEIYDESKHGVMFAAQKDLLNLACDPETSDDPRYVHSHLCDLPYERSQWPARDA